MPPEPMKGMTTMRPIRSLATALLVASLAVAGCGRSQPDESASQPSQPPVATAPPATRAPAPGGTTKSPPVVLVDGRHPVFLKTVDPAGRLITFDLIQLYFGEEARREELKDHDTQYPAPNDVYLRNVNPRLRTLPVPVDATISVLDNNFDATDGYASLANLAAVMPRQGVMPFWITVRHGQVVRIAEQYIP
jgi:hypothetical protein